MLIPEGKIYLVIKQLVKENYPNDLLLFETAWDGHRILLEEWKNKNPENWSIEDYRKLSLPFFPSPDKFEDSALFSLMMTVSAVVVSLSGQIDHSRIKEKAKVYTKQFGTPQALEPKIVSLLVEASGLEPVEKEFVVGADEEKSEEVMYVVYTDGKRIPCDGQTVKEFRDRKQDYTIWMDMEDEEVIIDKSEKDKPPPELMQLLRLFLRKTNHLCKNNDIEEFIWGVWDDNKSVSPGAIHQLKFRLIEWTGGIISPYIKSRREGYEIEKGLNYCLIDFE